MLNEDTASIAHAVAPGYALFHRVRWRIFGLLFSFGCVAYLQQKSVTVAAARMMPELGLSQMQIGWIQWAFLLGYTTFQIPGGVLGQRLGARRMFVVISLLAFLATVMMPLVPLALSGAAVFVGLLGLQLLLGLSQGAIFPVSSGVMETWFRPQQWALVQGLQVMGLQWAAALTPPLIATIMYSFGWQHALFWPALPALIVIAVWAWYARNSPAEHPSVTREELAELSDSSAAPRETSITWPRLKRVLGDRSILLLTFSYLCMNYVFYLVGNWCFLYLVQERHFSILESGWLAAAPPLAAAAGAGIGGKISIELCARFGVRWGMRLLPLVALPAAGVLLLVAVYLSNPYAAVLALTLGFASLELTEGVYFASTMYVARSDSMSATGVLNCGGNAGGLVAIPIVAYFSGQGEWSTAFAIGTGFALVSAIAWLGIDTSRRLDSHDAAQSR